MKKLFLAGALVMAVATFTTTTEAMGLVDEGYNVSQEVTFNVEVKEPLRLFFPEGTSLDYGLIKPNQKLHIHPKDPEALKSILKGHPGCTVKMTFDEKDEVDGVQLETYVIANGTDFSEDGGMGVFTLNDSGKAKIFIGGRIFATKNATQGEKELTSVFEYEYY